MCGLAGVLHPAGERADPADLQAMAAALAHRGPDAQGFFTDGPLGFAHRRLAILDLSDAGRQPMANEDGSVVAIYNGQLYRFQAVRDRLEAKGHRFRSRADTEILVHLYEEEGEALVESIDGMFAFALWDAGRRRLLLARDRLGIKPLYYVQHAGRLAFGSELRALLALPWLPRDIEETALVQYLYQSSVPGTSCIVRGVRKLGPGERLVAEDGRIRVERYWQPPTDTDEAIGLEGAAA
jgi:asparagine synthase (glutamine-hydrolysing)